LQDSGLSTAAARVAPLVLAESRSAVQTFERSTDSTLQIFEIGLDVMSRRITASARRFAFGK
jgi:hypothetical protein